MPARTALAKRASNYWRYRRVIRALMSAGGGLLAAKTKRRSDERESQREVELPCVQRRCCGRMKKTMTRGTRRDNKVQKRQYPEGGKISLCRRAEGKKASRHPYGKGERHYRRASTDLWSRYQFFSLRSRSDAILLEHAMSISARWRLPRSEERPICISDLSAELLTRPAFREHDREPRVQGSFIA